MATARRLAAVAHRGEQMLAWLAILTAVTLLLLAMPIVTLTLAEWQYWALFKSIAGWALGLFALAIMAAVVANAVTSAERPLGLVWDIICFFPRAAHPFTPPCYAERTVPEIEERLEDWFRGDAANERSVILSAHSMGAPIVVAVVFSVAADGAPAELDTAHAQRLRHRAARAHRPAHVRRAAARILRHGSFPPCSVRRCSARRARTRPRSSAATRGAPRSSASGRSRRSGRRPRRTRARAASEPRQPPARRRSSRARPHPAPPWSSSSAATSPRAGPRGGEASGVAPTISASRSSRTAARTTPWIAGRASEHRARTSGPWPPQRLHADVAVRRGPQRAARASSEAREAAHTRTRPTSRTARGTFSRRPAPEARTAGSHRSAASVRTPRPARPARRADPRRQPLRRR